MDDPVLIKRVGLWGTVLLIAGVGSAITLGQVRPMMAATREADAFGRAVEILSSVEGSVSSLGLEVDDVADQIRVSEALLPGQVNLDRFLSDVERIAEDSGVRVENLRPGEVERRPLYRELRVELRVVGDFLEVYAFISTLERTDQLARVQRLSIVGSPTSDCAADLRVVLYYAPPSEAAGEDS